jgi:hypothetical protein
VPSLKNHKNHAAAIAPVIQEHLQRAQELQAKPAAR